MTSATTALTYNGYVTQIATMAVVATRISSTGVVIGVDDPFNDIIPQMLNYAELRIQRDLDLLPSLVSLTQSPTTSALYRLTANTNGYSIPADDFVTIQTISVISGTRTLPLVPTTKEYLQNVYNDSSFTDTPAYFAMVGGDSANGGLTSNNILFGPYTDLPYYLQITGTLRLPTLYPAVGSNGYPTVGTGTTFISTYLPDLLIMASMIYLSAYQRNFGDTGNDPAMPGTYENQYQNLLKGASIEEARKKFNSAGWTSLSPAPVAALPR
jgi:hypothetical protein